MNRLTRDRTAEPVSRDQFSGTQGDREMFIFPVQLTTSRTGNLTRLIHTLLYVMAIHTYIPDVDGGVLPVKSTTQTVFNGDGIIIGGVREPLSRDKITRREQGGLGPFG